MRFDREETRKYYRHPTGQRCFDYLEQRDITSKGYVQALKDGEYGILKDNSIWIEEEEYTVECILADGKMDIFDLERNNAIYGIAKEEGTVFAILLGDDYLLLKPKEEGIYFFCRDTEETKRIANDYQEFERMIQYKEET